MKKSGLTNYALYDFNKAMTVENYISYQNDLIELQSQNENLTDAEFAKLLNESPEFGILQKYYIRGYLNKIESHTKITKTIVVIYFICSIIVGIIAGFSLL